MLLREGGVATSFLQLDESERRALGVESLVDVHLGTAAGGCRVLVGALQDDCTAFRDAIQQIARRLTSRAPQILWLLSVADGRGEQCALATWEVTESGTPRVASFVWSAGNVVDSDAETLRALSACAGEDSVLHMRWQEVLGRGSLTRRFFRVLDAQVGAIARSFPRPVRSDDAREVALLYVTRLLFLHFLQSKNWLDGAPAFLADKLDECLIGGGRFHERVLLPLFFGTLNTPVSRRAPAARAFGRVPFLNGGLFTRTAAERRTSRWRIPDERFAAIFDELFLRFRFVAREDTATWSEASIDPEMLGRAFESLMESSERKAGGVYYTPHELVERVTDYALDAVLGDAVAARALRLLDPACGSGAFLVHALERLAVVRGAQEGRPTADVRRDVLTGSIFGVDRSPTAVWLCQLRLWLSVLIESEEKDPLRVLPLPNLDRNVRVGDALTGPAFSSDQTSLGGGARLAALRTRYSRATGARKEMLARTLDREERRRVLAGLDRDIAHVTCCRRELVSLEQTRDLFGQKPPRSVERRRERRRLRERLHRLRHDRRAIADGGALPLAFGALFGDVQGNGGFHVIVGNPPWVRLHNIPAPLRLRFRESYAVFESPAWEAGVNAAKVSRGFASQVDLSALFVERSVTLLRERGVLGLLLPAKLWKSLAGGGVRRLLTERTQLLALEDLSDSPAAFDAAVYPSIVAARITSERRGDVRISVQHGKARTEWHAPPGTISFDASPASPWLLLPNAVRAAFDRLRAAGPALTTLLGAPRLGVKTGCNTAFIVRVEGAARGLASVVNADGDRGTVEDGLLRPALRGDEVARWKRAPATEHVLWTHDERGAPLARLPRRAAAWIGRYYAQLAMRADARGSGRWWSLFRTDAADSSRPRVVWADFGRAPRALVLPAGDPIVPLNTCYVVHCGDERQAWALCAILNSRVAGAWINAIAEPARGGYRRYLGWTVGLLPMPSDWNRALKLIGSEPAGPMDQNALDARVLESYRLRASDIRALVEWQECD